ncbi:hypothetical protein PG993_010423 [Apiospora rasikravindrae]|uniref:Uncharacterized protein n=1 Tax=Apiospora rasikravindrae TaxID=990691 RepID=A0ABR1SM71_9PEZI
MTSPKLESLAIELKVMILKEMDGASILTLISASPTYRRIFYAYYNEILEHSVSVSSDVLPEVLNDALAAASLPYPPNMNNIDKETMKDPAAAEKAVQHWKERKFAFAPAAPSRPPAFPDGCTVPGYPDSRFHLRDAVIVARLGSCIKDFINDYAAKARCDPLKDFYVYNNTPEWADKKKLQTKRKTSPIGPSKRLTKDELVKFQRAFFRFEFYARVHAHLEDTEEFSGRNNPLIQLAPSETEEVACAYGYLYSLQMLVLEMGPVDSAAVKEQGLKPQAYPVEHSPHRVWIPRFDADLLLRAKLASGGVKKVWGSVKNPSDFNWDISTRIGLEMKQRRGLMLGNEHNEFMKAVLNSDPQCCLRRCCNNQWGQVQRYRSDSRTSGARFAMQNIVRFDEGGAMSTGTKPNYSWDKWRNRQVKHIRDTNKPVTQRESVCVISTRRMCAWVFWDDSTLKRLRRYRMTDFKVIDFNGFLVEKDDGENNDDNNK